MKKVSNEDFVVAWVTADCMEDVVKATQLTTAGVRYKLKVLRARGVLLNDLPETSKKEAEVKDLNKLVAKYSRKDKNGFPRI